MGLGGGRLEQSCTPDPAVLWDWPPAAALFENLTKMPSSPSPVFRFGLHSRRFIFNTIHYLFLKFQSLFGSLETEEWTAGTTRARLCGRRVPGGVEGGGAVGVTPLPTITTRQLGLG